MILFVEVLLNSVDALSTQVVGSPLELEHVPLTAVHITGLGRVRLVGIRDDLTLMPSLSDLFMNTETQYRTLFTVVKSWIQIDAIVRATQSIVGDLEQADTGFMFVLPVSQVYGISKLA